MGWPVVFEMQLVLTDDDGEPVGVLYDVQTADPLEVLEFVREGIDREYPPTEES